MIEKEIIWKFEEAFSTAIYEYYFSRQLKVNVWLLKPII
jgi:hypothetical protein